MSELMTRSERDSLATVVRLRAKVTKAAIDTLAAERRADVERQLSQIEQVDNDEWKAAVEIAQRAVADANAAIKASLDARGTRPEFQSRCRLMFYGRGENTDPARRAELRRLALAKIDADRKAGYQHVEAWTADKLTTLISGLLTSDEARVFLDSLPSAETLLPPITVRAELGDGAAR